MDTPRKNNDCYFYYYSTCTKGDTCQFRHEESALGCEVVCAYWKEGKCFNQHCNFRHMELKKNRKSIPCYWETQPSGCCKPHCPFFHRNPRPGLDKGKEVQKLELATVSPTKRPSQGSESSFGTTSAVDPVVVSFEEESDSESVPSTPFKSNSSRISVKTLEQIKLDRIQAESAAYYSFSDNLQPDPSSRKEDVPFTVLSLEEIRRRKKKAEEPPLQPDSTTMKREEVGDGLQSNNVTVEQKVKPIRLKRSFERTGSEVANSRVKIKRKRIMDNVAVSSTIGESVDSEDFLSEEIGSSSLEDLPPKTPEDELLKDIDALLGD